MGELLAVVDGDCVLVYHVPTTLPSPTPSPASTLSARSQSAAPMPASLLHRLRIKRKSRRRKVVGMAFRSAKCHMAPEGSCPHLILLTQAGQLLHAHIPLPSTHSRSPFPSTPSLLGVISEQEPPTPSQPLPLLSPLPLGLHLPGRHKSHQRTFLVCIIRHTPTSPLAFAPASLSLILPTMLAKCTVDSHRPSFSLLLCSFSLLAGASSDGAGGSASGSEGDSFGIRRR